MVIGDSTVERNRFDMLCSLPALNAGIGWSKSADWLPDARKVIAAARPSIIVLGTGTNDTDAGGFRNLVRVTGANFAIAPRDPKKAERMRGLIPIMPAPTSYADDVHPDATGAAQWRKSIEQGCATIKIP